MKSQKKIKAAVIAVVISFVLVVSFIIFFLTSIQPNTVAGNAMNPNYFDGEKYLNYKNINDLERQDAIIFTSPSKGYQQLGRIIGLPGEKIIIKDSSVFVVKDNKEIKLEENYLSNGTKTQVNLKAKSEFLLNENEYFILGDNRNSSGDSRDFGPINKTQIKSKVGFCFFNCK